MRTPFKFLDAFTIKDKDTFFGRDQEIDNIYQAVFKTSLLLVYGSSGTGKTSLIQCGLANRFDGPDWYPIFIRRNENINDSVAEILKNALGHEAKGDLTEDISLLLRKSLRPVYLLFDQFEELFIRGKEAEQLQFMTALRKLLDAGLPSKVVLIMREEFIAQLYSYEELIPELFDHRFRVEVMGPVKIKQVITSSFEKFNIHLTEPKEELLELMVSNINDPKAGITLPYLQVYLDMLYRDVHQKQFHTQESEGLPRLEITKQAIDNLGRMDDVLERFLDNQTKELQSHLEKKYGGVNPRYIQSVLSAFVTDEGTKNPVSYKMDNDQIVLSEEASMLLNNIPTDLLTDIINAFQSDRILRKDNKTIELAHDSLALVIHQRKSASDRLLENIRKRLLNAYAEFKSTGAFLNNKQLAAFEEFRAQLMLSPELEKFLDDCENEIIRKEKTEQERAVKESKMAQRKKIMRIRNIFFIIFGVMIITALIGFNRLQATKAVAVQKKADEVQKKADELQKNMTEIDQQIDILESFLLNDTSFIRSEEDKNEFRNILQRYNYIDRSSRSTMFMEPLFTELNHFIARNGRFNELDQILTSLKSIVRADSFQLYDTNSNHAISIKNFTTNNPQDDPSLSTKDSVLTSERVSLSVHLTTPQPKETIQVKWLSTDGKVVAKPSYFQITQDTARMEKGDTTGWFSFSITLPAQATYLAAIYNREGINIGSYRFRIDTTLNENKVLPGNNLPKNDKIEFITMKEGSLNQPGESTKNFSVGDKLSYWLSIKSEKDEKIAVQLIDNTNKVIWSDDFLVEKNPVVGSRVYSWHGANQPGTYYIKLTNMNGVELIGFPITIR